MRDARLKASRADIVAAVRGRVTAHPRFLLQRLASSRK